MQRKYQKFENIQKYSTIFKICSKKFFKIYSEFKEKLRILLGIQIEMKLELNLEMGIKMDIKTAGLAANN